MKNKWVKQIIRLSLTVTTIIILAGCSCDQNVTNQNPPAKSTSGSSNSNTVGGGASNNSGSGNTSTTVIPGTATEVDRGEENFNYDGWVKTGPDPDIVLNVRPEWEETKNQDAEKYFVEWAYPQQKGSKITYEVYFNSFNNSKEIVMDKVNALVKSGVDVEYGTFQFADSTMWPQDGYYYKCLPEQDGAKNENIEYDIQIFFTYGVSGGQMTYFSMAYKSGSDNTNNENAVTEDNFWKASYSLHMEPDIIVPPS